ncbi:hypothetical protein IV203_012530 [Nitzschia inconspicua]|uniref:Uncharacterized protein n=1 Tax=Nitzschia inconspicua TaxID=303405 RepID=A0A9K3PJW3_9STRA|nr:hypothetical protein IV203_012530 [Nitzschia inconspicua]
MLETLLDDRYDALSQRQESVASGALQKVEIESKKSRSNHVTVLSFEALKEILQYRMYEGICIKSNTLSMEEQSHVKKTKYDDLSWQSSLDLTIERGNNPDDSTLFTLLRTRRDKYGLLTGSSISALETDTSLEDNEMAINHVCQPAKEYEGEEPHQSQNMEYGDDGVEYNLLAHPKSKAQKPLMLDEKLTTDFELEEESTDDEEKKTNGVLDKYSTTKEVTAFERMMEKLNSVKQDGDDQFNSNHTRTTASSTVLESTAHTRGTTASVSLDAIFTLNSSIILTVRSIPTGEDEEEDGTARVEKDDDSSAWFGFNENCNPNVAILLDPVSSSRSEDASTSLFSMDHYYDIDSYNEDQIDSVALKVWSSDSDVVLRSDSDRAYVPSTGNPERHRERKGTAPASNIRKMVRIFIELLTPKCGGEPFFDGEIEFVPSAAEGETIQVEAETISEVQLTRVSDPNNCEDVTSLEPDRGQSIMEYVLQFTGLRNWNQDADEPRVCCGCYDTSADLDDSTSIVEDEERTLVLQKKKRKPANDGCKEAGGNTSDEEGEGGVAVLVEAERMSPCSKKLPPSKDDQVEIMLEDYMVTVVKIQSHFSKIETLEDEKDSDCYIGIESKHSEEVQSLIDHSDFKVGAIIECEQSGSEEDMNQDPLHAVLIKEESVHGGAFAIECVPSNDSFCIPNPPEKEYATDNAFGSPLDSLSCDSFVLTYSSDDINFPIEVYATKRVEINPPSHRRRHTFDHVPSYHQLFDFKKPVTLPFLAETRSQQQDDSFHTGKFNLSFSSSSKRKNRSIKASFQDVISTSTAHPDTPSDNHSVASHRRTDAAFLSIWNEIQDENAPTNRSTSSTCTGTPKNQFVKSDTSEKGKRTKVPDRKKTRYPNPPNLVPSKGILRKEGCSFGSGRRISWNEDQLANKEEKGILFYSGRNDPRSVCPLDKLVHELSGNQGQ